MSEDEAPASGEKSGDERTGLFFPANRIRRQMLEAGYAAQVSTTAAIMMAGVLEYITADLLDMAQEIVSRDKRSQITPDDILAAMRQDHELNLLFRSKWIAQTDREGKHLELHEVLRNEGQLLRQKMQGSQP